MTSDVSYDGKPLPVLSPEAERELTFSDNRLMVVFALDSAGNIQPFKAQGAIEVPFEPGLPVNNFQGISFINGNPRCCFTTTQGWRRCIKWG